MTEEVRISIYGVATGVLAILATQDFVSQNTTEAILQTVTAGTSLIAAIMTIRQRSEKRRAHNGE